MTKHQAERLFSFASWASDHPSDPIPGDRLDIQLDNHRLAIEDLRESLRNLLRADGKLNHDLITPESLPTALTQALVHQTRDEIEAFAIPALARARDAQTQLESTQLSLAAELEETRALLRESRALNQKARDLSIVVDQRVQAALARSSEALVQVQAQAQRPPLLGYGAGGFYASDDPGAAAVASDYAQVAIEWAEHLPDTIPPNILAINAISGDHWSSRWWAMRAAGAFGALAWMYMGAFAGAPPSTPLTPTGQPIPPGAMYFDTVLSKMLVWNGSTWVPLAQGPAKATTSSLYYLSAAGQTVFPLSVADRFGQTFAFNQASPEGLQALVNGVRLVPTDDYSVNTVSSTVTLARPASLNAIVSFDTLTPVSQLTPSGTVNTVLLSPIVPDGVKTVFTGLTVASNGHATNIAKNEEILVSVDGIQQQPGATYNATGAQITFTEAPLASANIFIVWFGPANP